MHFSGIDQEAENGLGDAQNRGVANENVSRVTKRNPIKKTKMTAIKWSPLQYYIQSHQR